MNGNDPYRGSQDLLDAGERASEDIPEMSSEQRSALRESVDDIVAKTKTFLPDEYIVGSEIESGINGLTVTVAVQPPVGNPVTAGFEPDISDQSGKVTIDDGNEVARGLAASAAFQVKQAVNDDFTPVAK
ncbi:MAG: DUF5811 family protein [Halobacteriaceae archaeon]